MRNVSRFLVPTACFALLLSACGAGKPSAISTVHTLPASASRPADPTTPGGITATGTGTVAGAPNVMTVTVGVQTTAAHATDALKQNGVKASALIAALKNDGVADKDIQTSQLSVSPHTNGSNTITGYDVTNSVTAKVRDISKAGQVIDDALGGVGDAGRLQGVFFSIDDNSALLAQARQQAVATARKQAEQLAAAAGVKLGGLRSVTEDSGPIAMNRSTMDAAPAGSTPIQPGTQENFVQVTVVWDIA